MNKVTLKEHKRTYLFPDDENLVFHNVVEFSMPGSTHRLKLATGEHVIVAPGWLAIMIEGIDDWTM